MPFMRDIFRFWHEPDEPGWSDDVRRSGQTGSGWRRVKPARLTQGGPSHRSSSSTSKLFSETMAGKTTAHNG
jgi:hypothetical protein